MLSQIEFIKKRKQLLYEIAELRQEHYELVYAKVKELYYLEISRDPEYTIRQMAVDLTMAEQYLYKMMSFNNAPDEIKKMVNDKKITLMKAVRVLSFVGKRDKKYIIKTFNYVVGKNMTDHEIDRYVKKAGIKDVELDRDRNEKDGWNLFRDLMCYCFRMDKNLPNVSNVPKGKKKELKLGLIETKNKIEIAIKVLEE